MQNIPVLEKPLPFYQQIEASLRQMIEKGEWNDGARLPPFAELASRFGTSVFTIQKAIKPLVAEGLLECHPKKGTTRRLPSASLTRVGVYFSKDFGDLKEWAFYRCLREELRKRMEGKHGKLETWLDSRPLEKQNEPFEGLLRSVKARQIQGLVASALQAQHHRWLKELGIPVVGTSGCEEGGVKYDLTQMVAVSMDWLANQGCRRMGMISLLTCDQTFRNEILRLASVRKMETRSEWMRFAPGNVDSDEVDSFGYRQFQEIWNSPMRPEGLLVYPDTLIPGVTMAILKQGVQAPARLRLVFHRNEEVDIFSPLPAAQVVSSVGQTAEGLLQQLEALVAGKKTRPITLPFVLRPEAARYAIEGVAK